MFVQFLRQMQTFSCGLPIAVFQLGCHERLGRQIGQQKDIGGHECPQQCQLHMGFEWQLHADSRWLCKHNLEIDLRKTSWGKDKSATWHDVTWQTVNFRLAIAVFCHRISVLCPCRTFVVARRCETHTVADAAIMKCHNTFHIRHKFWHRMACKALQ